jgi:hypothetical protein
MSLSNRRRLALAAVVTVGSATAIPADTSANVGNFDWSGSDSLYSGNYSNVAGFWQAIICGNSPGIYLDGIYGNQSKAATLRFKKEVLGWTNATNQNVTSGTWTGARNSSHLGFIHLQPLGNGYYSYYAGSSNATDLYWNGDDWKFLQIPSNTWYVATTSRTMGSTLCF